MHRSILAFLVALCARFLIVILFATWMVDYISELYLDVISTLRMVK